MIRYQVYVKAINNNNRNMIPVSIRDRVHYYKMRFLYGRGYRRLLNDIRNNNHVKVAFVIMSLPMWKNQKLLELMLADSRFSVKVVLSPACSFSKETQLHDMERLRRFFTERGIFFEDYDRNKVYDLRGDFNPDIIFYQQPYENIHCQEHDFTSFPDKLLCYVPYSFWPGAEIWGFDRWFHRMAWRIYYANDLLLQFAKSVSLIGAKNSVIVGYPSADLFLAKVHNDVWKCKDKNVKRIIWAPHYSINSKTAISTQSSFLLIADEMLRLAKENVGVLHIAFKPHPRLKSELYRYSGWGKEKADEYYKLWETMPNTQLETGEYVDLFMTSDALVHDSGSFMVEYQYSQKPSLFVSPDYQPFYNRMNNLGKAALDCHYTARGIDGVKQFIDDVVIKGRDEKKEYRENFRKDMLLPPGGRTVAENIYYDLLEQLNLR